ncbi:hypothetical protein WS62_22155 [Burkholderia sp. ABCPW 14]|nr:hypothetical protein WS62_22155 [Burkholderia sp. ABCPW 14]
MRCFGIAPLPARTAEARLSPRLAPPERTMLVRPVADAGPTACDARREKGARCAKLGLAARRAARRNCSTRRSHPILINRPFVVALRGARHCRPSERVRGTRPSPLRARSRRKAARSRSIRAARAPGADARDSRLAPPRQSRSSPLCRTVTACDCTSGM